MYVALEHVEGRRQFLRLRGTRLGCRKSRGFKFQQHASIHCQPNPQQSSSMADDTLRTLVCLIAGESSLRLFKVNPTVSMDIMDLKGLIKEKRKNGVLSGVDAKDLTLWKVRMTMARDDTTNSPAG